MKNMHHMIMRACIVTDLGIFIQCHAASRMLAVCNFLTLVKLFCVSMLHLGNVYVCPMHSMKHVTCLPLDIPWSLCHPS